MGATRSGGTMQQRSLLEPTGNEAAEREALADAERPGVWAGEDGADLRALTQEQTDQLIRAELIAIAPPHERDEVAGACGGPPARAWLHPPQDDAKPRGWWHRYCANAQRGGIDSDPLVRLLAVRAWGDRDRRWFELRGVRAGERVAQVGVLEPARPWNRFEVALAWNRSEEFGEVLADARPGEHVSVRRDLPPTVMSARAPTSGAVTLRCRVGDRLREPSPGGVAADPLARVRQLYGFDELWSERDLEGRAIIFTAVSYGMASERRRIAVAARVPEELMLHGASDPVRVVIGVLDRLSADLLLEPALHAPHAVFEELLRAGSITRQDVMSWFARRSV